MLGTKASQKKELPPLPVAQLDQKRLTFFEDSWDAGSGRIKEECRIHEILGILGMPP